MYGLRALLFVGFCLGILLVSFLVTAEDNPTSYSIEVPGSQTWTDTGIDILKESPFHIEATGDVSVVGLHLWEWVSGLHIDRHVGPKGTYVWPRRYKSRGGVKGHEWPLPTMHDGPWPAFCLVGKIGEDGKPFYVGERYNSIAQRSGRLWLGINDDYVLDNRGEFQAKIELTQYPIAQPSPPPHISPGQFKNSPIPDARVLLLYIDGLRLDVMKEMADAGFLPNLKQAFLERGLTIPNTFTVFPSNTLISNGSLFTGRFSDRTGIKSQSQFERATLKSRGQLSEWLPDIVSPKRQTRVINLLDKYAPENTHTFLMKYDVPTLGSRLGEAFKFTILPIAPINPPPQWFHRAVNTIGPINIKSRIPQRIDKINAEYAIEDIFGNADARVMAVWFPMVDKTSHFSPHGQYGASRRDLVLVDEFFGRMLERLTELGWAESTYVVLVSDHGHIGGNPDVNRRANLPRDWAYRELGVNARVLGDEWEYPGINEDRFFFFDNQGAGQAKLFLPNANYLNGEWKRNRLYELTHYHVRPGQAAVDLIETLAQFRGPEWDDKKSNPVDLILVKLDDNNIFIYRNKKEQALIHIQQDDSGRDIYRYEPVQALHQSADGVLHYQPADSGKDPLGYLEDHTFIDATGGQSWLGEFHDTDAWLEATYQTPYPDAIVAIGKFFSWKDSLRSLAPMRDPDLVVTASNGWSFRSDDKWGTDHGYLLADSMRITLCLAGANIPWGEMEAPYRMVDVLPTILHMIDEPYDPATMDGKAITGIYKTITVRE